MDAGFRRQCVEEAGKETPGARRCSHGAASVIVSYQPRSQLLGKIQVAHRSYSTLKIGYVCGLTWFETAEEQVLVRLHTPLPPAKIGAHDTLAGPSNLRVESMYGPNAGLTEVLIPAGSVTEAWDPVFRLSAGRKRYVPAPAEAPTALTPPGLPFSLVFRAEPGREDIVLRIASAYEAASRRRIQPAFGHLPK